MNLSAQILQPIAITRGKAKVFTVAFTVLQPCYVEVSFEDMDPSRPNTCYCCEGDFLQPGNYRWNLKFPVKAGQYKNVLTGEDLAPKQMLFRCKINDGVSNYTPYFRARNLLDVHDMWLKPTGLTKIEAEFHNLMMPLCLMMGYLPTGQIYYTDDGHFGFDFLDHITTDDGALHPTPMRIAQRGEQVVPGILDYIQGSGVKLIPKPVPRRWAIGCHEFKHNNGNTNPNSEEQADLNGLKYFLKTQWSKQEYTSSFERTFDDAIPKGFNAMNNPAVAENAQVLQNRLDLMHNFLGRSNFLTQ